MNTLLTLFQQQKYMSRSDSFKVKFNSLTKEFLNSMTRFHSILFLMISLIVSIVFIRNHFMSIILLINVMLLISSYIYCDSNYYKKELLTFTFFDLIMIPIMLFFSSYLLVMFIVDIIFNKILNSINTLLKIRLF